MAQGQPLVTGRQKRLNNYSSGLIILIGRSFPKLLYHLFLFLFLLGRILLLVPASAGVAHEQRVVGFFLLNANAQLGRKLLSKPVVSEEVVTQQLGARQAVIGFQTQTLL